MSKAGATVPTLALIFKYTPDELKKSQAAVSKEYASLLKACQDGGLVIAGKRSGKSVGTLVVFVDCLDEGRKNALVSWEHAVSSSTASANSALPAPTAQAQSPSTFLRALHTYLTAPKAQGGLGITPKSTTYPHLDAIVSPHPKDFKSSWLSKLPKDFSFGYSEKDILEIGVQYGEPAAQYFAFLTHYARSLVLPSVIGIGLWRESPAFVQHPAYSALLILWAIVFIEQWRQKALRLSASLSGTAVATSRPVSANPVTDLEKKNEKWWVVEAKTLVTIPLVLGSVAVVCFNMTVAFLLEAFVARLYGGPLSFLAGLVPTVYNILTTPPFVAIFTMIANKVTTWEGHSTQRGHETSLLFKLLPINATVAFYALILSAGVYIPFGDELMSFFHLAIFPSSGSEEKATTSYLTAWWKSIPAPPPTTPATRLSEQMFSFTLVLQLIPLLMEILVPFVIRFVTAKLAEMNSKKDTSVVVKSEGNSANAELVDRVVYEAGLPTHRFFEDYLTIVLQFGYGVMWSTTWPLTPAVLMLLAFIKLRTDALKILVHYQRTVPTRGAAEAEGVWVGALSTITWAGALTNALLLVLIDPLVKLFIAAKDARPHRFDVPTLVKRVHSISPTSLVSPSALGSHFTTTFRDLTASGTEAAEEVFSPFATAAIILLASYAYFIAQAYIRHLLASVAQDGQQATTSTTVAPALGAVNGVVTSVVGAKGLQASDAFWGEDEGESEIMKKTI
ncbi:hypothetical protein DL93DRAFT_1649104 [Clavulina sp. PMI_390]|nr:hypothetical protein DL93DRAFT_1649104 [Clavulina sp. PMI_390]